MIEPTESESITELDRFADAMISIREEIRAIENGEMDKVDNALKNAPHTCAILAEEIWKHPYTRKEAVFPTIHQYQTKFWPPVGRVDNAYGDRNLICSCLPLEEYEKELQVANS